MARPRLHYLIEVPAPASHLAQVTLRIDDAVELGDRITIRMAAWCPGSYLVRDYARFVRDLEVCDQDGGGLPARKTTKQSWEIERGEATAIVVRYAVYGYDLSVRTNHIDDTHAFLHGPATYLWLEERRAEPASVEVEVPDAGWQITSGLARDPDGGYVADDLDTLLDCPVHLGIVATHRFSAAGADFELAVWGEPAPGIRDLDDLEDDLEAIIATHAERFGGVPFERYAFILMLSPKSYGGLEHRTSSANLSSTFALAKESSYRELLELLSHEFFHVWNGKRIYPAALSPFDYERENYTRCLWVIEGLTNYYDRYTVLRAGHMSARQYLEKLTEEWGKLTGIPGRRRHSLEDSSFDAWIKLYKPDPSNLNTTVSYYLKGGLVALALDLRIRRETAGARDLTAVLALLWREYGSRARGYPENVRPIFEEATGLDLAQPFADWIEGRDDPDVAGELAHVGLSLSGAENEGAPRAYLGVAVGEPLLRVRGVLDDSPAAVAGIAPGDELVAVDGLRVGSDSELRRRLVALAPGDRIELAVFRRQRLLHIGAELAESPPRRYVLSSASEPSEGQKRRYSGWLGEDWPAEGLSVGAPVKRWT